MHKYYSVEDWKQFALENPDVIDFVAVSTGTGKDDFTRLSQILEAIPKVVIQHYIATLARRL